MNYRAILLGSLIVAIALLSALLFYNIKSEYALYPAKAKALLAAGKIRQLVDVRTEAEWDLGHLPKAVHIPLAELEETLPQKIPQKTTPILFYCNTSTRARMAAERAKKLGYKNVHYLIGTHLNLLN